MYLGLDLGTSGLKALLISEQQQVVAESRVALTVNRPFEGWSEQNPADWIRAAESALDELAAQHSLESVVAIGLSGHMHGAVLLDAADKVLRPCIMWNDIRSHQQAASMDAEPPWREISGNIVFPGFTAPKLAWVAEHEPEIFDKVSKILLPKDYLRLWLSGEHVAEMSDAAGTSWLDTGARDWSDELLEMSGLSREHMPRLVEGSAVSATIRPKIADRWSIPTSTIIAGGGGDNAASAIGVGVVKAGDAFVSLGTSGVLFAANDGYVPDAATAVHTFCHALPATWHQMGVILSASDALEWYAHLTGQTAAELSNATGALMAPGKPLFLPYLSGERTPHNNARIRGAFLGLERATDAAAGTRAVLEGVSFAIRDCRDALAQTGTDIDNLIAIGGGSASRYWLQVLATTLDTPIDIPVAGDFGAAFGAARLAMMAANNEGEDITFKPAIAERFEPDNKLRRAFDDGFVRYQAAYQAVNLLS